MSLLSKDGRIADCTVKIRVWSAHILVIICGGYYFFTVMKAMYHSKLTVYHIFNVQHIIETKHLFIFHYHICKLHTLLLENHLHFSFL